MLITCVSFSDHVPRPDVLRRAVRGAVSGARGCRRQPEYSGQETRHLSLQGDRGDGLSTTGWIGLYNIPLREHV